MDCNQEKLYLDSLDMLVKSGGEEMVDKHVEECECDKPEIRDSFKGDCSEEQIVECHGREMLEKLKKEGEI